MYVYWILERVCVDQDAKDYYDSIISGPGTKFAFW